MFKHIRKDYINRLRFFHNEYRRMSFLFLLYNFTFNNNSNFRNRIIFLAFFNDTLKNISSNRIHNFCFYSGRARGVYRFTHTSRIIFRELASRGSLFGLHKK